MQTEHDAIDPIGPSRRHFLAGLVTTTTVFITGCGGGSSGESAQGESGATTSPTPPVTGGGDVPVVVARNLGPQPAPSAGVDGGIKISASISAARGGQFDIPGGARLAIPAGALAADTEIVVTTPTRPVAGQHAFVFGPEGLRFSTPARLAMPIPAASDLSVLFAIHSSVLNDTVNVGSEKTNFQPLKTLSRTATHVNFELEHFSYLSASEASDAGVHLVTDIPGECLSPGDMTFYLTETDATSGWNPGHVAMLVKDDGGNANDPRVKRTPGLLVEAGGASGGVGFSTIDETKFAYGHNYLGPYRHPTGLTQEQQDGVRQFLFSKLGKEYALIGIQGTPIDLVQPDNYSCVGLCDAALRSVGKGLANFLTRAHVSTPYEFFRSAVPVADIEVKAGQLLEIPVYGVIVDARRNNSGPLTKLVFTNHSRRVAHTVAARKAPQDSTFLASDLRASQDVNDRAPGYLFSWFPKKEQIGQVFELDLELATLRINAANPAAGLQVRDQVRRVIKMKVVPGANLRYLDHDIADRFVNVGKDSTVVYAWFDSDPRLRRISRLNPPTNGDFGQEALLDLDTRVELVDGNQNNVVLAQFQETVSTTPSRVRHQFLSYTVAAGAPQNSTLLGSVDITFSPNVGVDSTFVARAISSNGDVVGSYKKFTRFVPGYSLPSTRDEVWWIPKNGTVTKVDVHAAFFNAVVAAHPQAGITRGEEFFGMTVFDINSAGVVLVAGSIAHSANGVTGMEVAVAACHLATGQIVLLAYLFERSMGVSGPGAVYAARINDTGQAVITLPQGLTSGGIVSRYHEGLPTRLPKAGALRSLPNFWVNAFTSKADAGGFVLKDGMSKATVWRAADNEVVDTHTQLVALDPALKSAYASSVARVGESGTVVGRVIARRLTVPGAPAGAGNPEVDWPRDFVISPG